MGLQSTDAAFRSHVQTAGNNGDIDILAMRNELIDQLDIYTSLGSGCSLLSIDDFIIHIARFNPLVGSSYIDLPPFLKNKGAIINVQNEDEYCFK